MCAHIDQLAHHNTIEPCPAMVMVTCRDHETGWASAFSLLDRHPPLSSYQLVVSPQAPAKLRRMDAPPEGSAPGIQEGLSCASPWDAARAVVADLLQPVDAP